MRKYTFLLLAAIAAVASTIALRERTSSPAADLPVTAPAIPVRPASAPAWPATHSLKMPDNVQNPAPAEPHAYSASRVPEPARPARQPAAMVASASSVAPASLSRNASYRRPTQAPHSAPTIPAAPAQNPQPVIASGFSLGNISNPAPPLAVELDRGVQLPIALLKDEAKDEAPITPVQAAVKRQIANEFTEQINEAIAQGQTDPKSLDEFWSRAQGWANWEYQKFFGSEAANRAGLRAGAEALAAP